MEVLCVFLKPRPVLVSLSYLVILPLAKKGLILKVRKLDEFKTASEPIVKKLDKAGYDVLMQVFDYQFDTSSLFALFGIQNKESKRIFPVFPSPGSFTDTMTNGLRHTVELLHKVAVDVLLDELSKYKEGIGAQAFIETPSPKALPAGEGEH